MLDIKEAAQLSDVKKLEKEIAEREELIKNMIGTLYPSILLDEIHNLTERICQLEKHLHRFRIEATFLDVTWNDFKEGEECWYHIPSNPIAYPTAHGPFIYHTDGTIENGQKVRIPIDKIPNVQPMRRM